MIAKGISGYFGEPIYTIIAGKDFTNLNITAYLDGSGRNILVSGNRIK